MNSLTWCLVAAVGLQLLVVCSAVCCHSQKYRLLHRDGHISRGKVCKDCRRGTPYCSRTGSCNLFGCNCDGGCRVGRCSEDENARSEENTLSSQDAYDVIRAASEISGRSLFGRIGGAHDVIRAADVDVDGRMSVEEARLHLGLPADRVRRSLMELDTDNDDFLSAQEIDN